MRITKRTTILDTNWIKVIAKDIEGWDDAYYTVSVPDYTSILAMTPDRKILTVRQFRVAVEEETLELPSGMVDAGEDPIDCASRELLEETGYVPADMVAFGHPMVPDTGRLTNRMHIFFARDVTLHPDADALIESGIQTELYSEAELLALIRNGTFNHALNLAVLTYAMMEGLINLT